MFSARTRHYKITLQEEDAFISMRRLSPASRFVKGDFVGNNFGA